MATFNVVRIAPIAHEITPSGAWLELNRHETANALRSVRSWPTTSQRFAVLAPMPRLAALDLDGALMVAAGLFTLIAPFFGGAL